MSRRRQHGPTFGETHYRVVGHEGASSQIRWYRTAMEAIEQAWLYERAIIVRPDGQVMGEYFRPAAPGVAARQVAMVDQAIAILDTVAEQAIDEGADTSLSIRAADALDVLEGRTPG